MGRDNDNDNAPAPPPPAPGLDGRGPRVCLNVSFDDRYPGVKEDFHQRAQALVDGGGGGVAVAAQAGTGAGTGAGAGGNDAIAAAAAAAAASGIPADVIASAAAAAAAAAGVPASDISPETIAAAARAAAAEGSGGGNGSGGRQKVRIDYRNEATGEEGSAEVDTNDDDAMSSEPRRRIRWCRTIARRLANDHNWQLKDTVVEVDDAISTLSNRSDPATIAATTPATPTAAAAAAQGGAVPRRRKPRLPATIHFDYRNRKTGEESSHSAVQTNDVRSCHSAAPITLFLPICTSILFYFY